MKKNILIFASFIVISFIMINCEKITPEALSSPKGTPGKPGNNAVPFLDNIRKLQDKLVTVSQNQQVVIIKENGDIIFDHPINGRKVYTFVKAMSDSLGLYRDQLYEERNPGMKKTLGIRISDNELYETGISVALIKASFDLNLPRSKVPIDENTASSRLEYKIAMLPVTAYTENKDDITEFLKRINLGQTRTLYGNKKTGEIKEVFIANKADAERRTFSVTPIVFNEDGTETAVHKQEVHFTILGIINDNTCIGESRGSFTKGVVISALTFSDNQVIILESTKRNFSLESSKIFFKEMMESTDIYNIFS